MIKEKLEQLTRSLTPRKENVRPLIISIAITLVFFLGINFLGDYFATAMWIFDSVMLGFLLLFFMIVAGFTVLKSLFFVAAELSLLIFLAQSYCAVPNRLAAGDQSLKSLLAIGILYIVISFLRSLYEVIKTNYKKVENERWSVEKIIAVSLYLIFIFLFLWQVYRVVGPIILNLCIYK